MENKDTVEKYNLVVNIITEEQSKIVGSDVATSLASSVRGLKYNGKNFEIIGDPRQVIKSLVDTYYLLFGDVSIQVSRDAVHSEMPRIGDLQLPENLR